MNETLPLGKKARNVRKLLTLLVLAVILLVILNGSRYYFRVDFSSGKLFSLSPVTRETITSIPEKMQITYYLSDKMKTLYPQVRDISDLLGEFAAASGGTISVAVVDPEKEKLENTLKSMGIASQQIQTVDKNETSFSNVYSAIVIEYPGRAAYIPFIISPAGLEYELTSRIASLISNRSRKASVLIGNGFTSANEYQFVIPWLTAAGIVCEEVSSAAELTDVSAPLVVLGSSLLTLADTAAIEAFVLKGGRVLFAVSSHDVDIYSNWAVQEDSPRDVADLLEHWGMRLGQELVLDISNFRMTMRSGPEEASSTYQYINYPFWIVALASGVSGTNPITAGFSGLELYWPSPLYLEERDDISIEPLVNTTPAAWLTTPPFVTDPFARYSPSESPQTMGRYPVAAASEGSFPGYLTGIERGEPSRIVVVADQYFPSTMIEYTSSPNNMDFLVNAVLWLSGDDDLLAVKNKAITDTRLNKVSDPEVYAGIQTSAYAVTFVAVPLAVIAAGALAMLFRNRKGKKDA